MLSVVILGTGNVAFHLARVLKASKGVQLLQVYGRTTSKLKEFNAVSKVTDKLGELKDADIYLVAVSDGAISSFTTKLDGLSGIVAHTSGAVPLSAIDLERPAVFYPLQTFSKDKKIDFNQVPICLETKNTADMEKLELLASHISNRVHLVDSNQRKQLHLAAIWVNNFTNHLFYIGQKLCEDNRLPFNILKPLIEETVKKISHLNPMDAQTGPARRDDVKTMQSHLELLEEPIQKKIYQLLSESIKSTYEKEL